MTTLAILLLGFFLGMRHATDVDHVVAVTTIVSRERTARGALWVGALWGLGHSATILTVGGAIVLFGWVIPPRVGLSMEMSVAIMLVVLGVMNFSGALSQIERVAHRHGAAELDDTPHSQPPRLRARGPLRPLIIGVVHGLAGSAAIALLVLATINDARRALLYLAVFGAGTLLGMMMLTMAMALPISVLAKRVPNVEQRLARITGLVSIALGLFLAYRIGIGQGLLLGDPTWHPR